MALRTSLGRVGRPLLGVAVFVGALVIWEVWARHAGSFLVPPASEVLDRAWHIWPTRDFLADVAASLRRLAVGFAIGAGSRHRDRAPHGILACDEARARSARRARAGDSAHRDRPCADRRARRRAGHADRGDRVRRLLPRARQHRRGRPGRVAGGPRHGLDAARRPRGTRLPHLLPAALPSIVAGLRVAVSIGLVLVVISEFVGTGDGLGSYIWALRGQFLYPEMYAAILFLGLLGYALNRLFLVAERRILAWHYGAAGESAR